MKILVFGTGPLGSLYAHLLDRSGADVTVLSRGERHDWIKKNGLVLFNEITGEKESSWVEVIKEIQPDDEFDLIIVFVRKNKLPPILESLAALPRLGKVLFMGNNVLGFDQFFDRLPAGKVFFGFPGAGGGIRDQVVHYADRERPKGRRRAVTIGGVGSSGRARLSTIKSLFESAGIAVDLTNDIDGWLKYHFALVGPIACALYKHDCNNYRVAEDGELLHLIVEGAKEGGRVLKALGFRKRQPFQFHLLYWLPKFLSEMALKKLIESKFAEVAFAMHARSARDEMETLVCEFSTLVERTSVETPNLDALRSLIK